MWHHLSQLDKHYQEQVVNSEIPVTRYELERSETLKARPSLQPTELIQGDVHARAIVFALC